MGSKELREQLEQARQERADEIAILQEEGKAAREEALTRDLESHIDKVEDKNTKMREKRSKGQSGSRGNRTPN